MTTPITPTKAMLPFIDKLIESTVETMKTHVRDGELQLGYAAQTSNYEQRAKLCRSAAASFERANASNLVVLHLFNQHRIAASN